MANIVERVWNFLKVVGNRSEDKTVQKVKHFEEVNKNGKMHKQVNFPLAGQIKKDGVFAIVVHTADGVRLFNRTGRRMTNVEQLEHKLPLRLDAHGVYFAELCNEQCSLEVLSGIVNPNRTEALDAEQQALLPSLKLWFHDYLKFDDFISGKTDTPYTTRHDAVAQLVRHTGCTEVLPIQWLYSLEEVEHYLDYAIQFGEEGIVVKVADAGWEAGHKGWRMMKLVRRVDYDLLCTAMEDGKGKMVGLVANLYFQWKDGETIKCSPGKGWTHETLRDLFVTGAAIGKVFRVKGLQDSSKGKIRLPKFEEERHDKVDGDY